VASGISEGKAVEGSTALGIVGGVTLGVRKSSGLRVRRSVWDPAAEVQAASNATPSRISAHTSVLRTAMFTLRYPWLGVAMPPVAAPQIVPKSITAGLFKGILRPTPALPVQSLTAMGSMLLSPRDRTAVGLALVSAASLAYEVTLTRLFAIQQFHHFAFLVVSMAVMGFAASGLALSIWPRGPRPWNLALAFSLSALVAYTVLLYLPFDSYSIAWDRRQVAILGMYFLAAGTPFLFAGWTAAAAMAAAGERLHQPYAANLVGAALGGPLALLTMQIRSGEAAFGLSIALGLAGTAAFLPRPRARLASLTGGLILLACFALPLRPLQFRLSPYKPLEIARLALGASHTLTRWSASTRVDVLESASIHVFPGLSLQTGLELPEQAGLFVDGDGPLPITHAAPEDPRMTTLAAAMPSHIAYQLRPNGRALILDAGAGLAPLLALTNPGIEVHLPVEDPLILEVLRGPYASFSEDLAAHTRLHWIPRAARGVLAQVGEPYRLIEFALSDSFRPITSGAFSLSEDYLLTVEAFQAAWRRLDPDGLLVVTRWIETPPSESTRTWVTLMTALRAEGIIEVEKHLIAFRGMRTVTILAARQPFNDQEIASVRSFLRSGGYDALALPGLRPDEVNRFNILPEPVYHRLFMALLKDPEATITAYPFDLRPPSDLRPYFFHFFRWGQTRELLAQLGTQWQPFGGSGYLVLLALLALMVLAAVPMILIPAVLRRRRERLNPPGLMPLLYFAGLGAGYLLIEIPLIQISTLILDRPALALANVLLALLLTSGLGSLLSPRVRLRWALPCLCLFLFSTIVAAGPLSRAALPASMPVRWLLTFVWILPLGVLMGIPFAAGLRKLEAASPGWIPWAWAINGSLSGISGVIAAILGLAWGFRATLVAGLAAYLLAWLSSGFLPRARH